MGFDIARYRASIDSFHSLMEESGPLSAARVRPDAWTLGEMVGHLIDSASNNHQRFIRLQLIPVLRLPGYDEEEWKQVSRVESYDYPALVSLWKAFNDYLLHLIRNMGGASLDHYWEIGDERKTLAFLVEDYFTHMEWHRRLFMERIAEIRELP